MVKEPANWWHEIVVFKPLGFEEACEAVLAVRQQRTVLLNVSRMDSELGRRTIDFVLGGVTALDGHLVRIDENVFLFAPALVTINEIRGAIHREPTAKSADC
ncbi:MAG: cell division protein SepF [Prochlorococcus sp.]|jgi:FtsZ-interacting cell division protein YlmF|nr:cell division protein SepF [Prochlorococcaceae cyanobacterium Fu_MAG_134]|tara:strand:+ start:136 stop:441 length:306 start_codon:yes stop_codon:yes gene_type:complete